MKKMTKEDVQAMFASAKEKAASNGEFEKIENGTHSLFLKDCVLHEAKSGKLFVKNTWEVLDGEQEGKTFLEFKGCDNEVGLSILFQEWGKLGVDFSDFVDFDSLEAICSEVADTGFVVRMQVTPNRNNPDYQNWRIIDLLETGYGVAAAPTPPAKAKEAPKEKPVPVEKVEESEEDEDSQEATLEVGAKVSVKKGRKTFEAEVIELYPEDEVLVVKDDSGAEHELAFDAVQSILG